MDAYTVCKHPRKEIFSFISGSRIRRPKQVFSCFSILLHRNCQYDLLCFKVSLYLSFSLFSLFHYHFDLLWKRLGSSQGISYTFLGSCPWCQRASVLKDTYETLQLLLTSRFPYLGKEVK